MIVRNAQARDAEAWLAIVREAATDGTAQIATHPDEIWTREELVGRFADAGDAHAYLVCQREGAVVGILSVHRGFRVAFRHTAEFGITVAARARGMGVGTALVRAAEERARSWGVTKMCLGVFAHNTRAHALYTRLGYHEEGVRRGHFLVDGKLRDEIMMAKWIA